MEGWGGVCKWKKRKEDSRSQEQICAYTSGRFKTVQSTIDAEINACINTLERLKIHYLDNKEITLRTDCQAIISFYNKTNSNKASRVRWLKFTDAVTGTGVQINIEHIDGKQNVLADSLSRMVTFCLQDQGKQREANVIMKAVADIVQDERLNRNQRNKELKQIQSLLESMKLLPITGLKAKEQQQEMSYPLAQRFTQENSSAPRPRNMADMNLAQFHEAHKKEQDCKTQWYEAEAHDDSGKWEWYGARFGTYSIRARRLEAQSQTEAQGKEIIAQAKEATQKKERPKGPLDQKMKGLAINLMIKEETNKWAEQQEYTMHNRYKPNKYQASPRPFKPKEEFVMHDDQSQDNGEIIVDPGWDDWGIKAIKQNRVDVCGGARYCRL